jgi:hypothetical protein
MNTDVVGATPSSVKPRDGTTIPYYTIIWASGVTPSKLKVHGFLAWWLWRTYYLANLQTMKKKLKVLSDWMMDLIYKPDVAMIKKFIKDEELEKRKSYDKRKEKLKNSTRLIEQKIEELALEKTSKLLEKDLINHKLEMTYTLDNLKRKYTLSGIQS